MLDQEAKFERQSELTKNCLQESDVYCLAVLAWACRLCSSKELSSLR